MFFFLLFFFFFSLNLTQIELAFQKVFQEIRNKRKNNFKKANYFFLVFAHRFWGYTPLPEKTDEKHCFFDDPIILTNICLLPALKKMPLKHFFQYKKNKSLLSRLYGQTLPNATPPIRKIHQCSKIVINIELVMQFWWP